MGQTELMLPQDELVKLFEQFSWECQFSGKLSKTTIRGYRSVFCLFLVIMPEINSAKQLTPQMMVEFFKRLDQRTRFVGKAKRVTGIKSSTAKTYWTKLNSFFNWLERYSIIKNPLQNIRPPKVVYEDVQSLKETEIRRIYSSITLHSRSMLEQRRNTVMVSLLLFCGLRLGEFISLEVRDIDFQKKLLTVRAESSKSKKSRYIPLHPTLILHLQDYISERNRRGYKSHLLLVSCKQDTGLTVHGLKHWVKTMNAHTGVRFHVHQFRHTFATNLAHRDVNIIKIQKLLGHSSPVMTMTYLRAIETKNLHDEISRLSI